MVIGHSKTISENNKGSPGIPEGSLTSRGSEVYKIRKKSV